MFINLTPHPINIHYGGGVLNLAQSGTVPRLEEHKTELAPLDGVPLCTIKMGVPQGLPAPQEGVYLVVSALVANHPSVSNRNDLLYPGPAVRDENGRIVGCRGLCVPETAAVNRVPPPQEGWVVKPVLLFEDNKLEDECEFVLSVPDGTPTNWVTQEDVPVGAMVFRWSGGWRPFH